ncbi:MAG TPA: prephenate dehydrogenase/arogenate dehydrogenase family protein [Anaerolineales bacterium]|nr:prephenate dehydrogenase/arogenate dehydrogenase family protein [Anaerolineales bacterium]
MEGDFSLQDSTVGILGLGLMGGSLAMGLKGHCARLIGFDSHPPTLEFALSKNVIDQAEAFFPSPFRRGARGEGHVRADILIIATPVPTIIDLLQRLPSLISTPCIVMDIGSTKRDILQAMSALPDNFDPLGGHPICGKEKLGLENADANLYQNAPFIITPLEKTTQRAKSAAQQIISAIGANLIEMTAEEHDCILATTSHLPFLISSSLTYSTPHEYSPFLGPGFRSTSRLAGTPSHMMMGILKSNRDNVLNAIQSFRNSLTEFESALRDENYDVLENILNESQSAYHALVYR